MSKPYIQVDWADSHFAALQEIGSKQHDDSARIHPADAHRVIDFLLRQQPRPLPLAVSDAFSALRKLVHDYADEVKE